MEGVVDSYFRRLFKSTDPNEEEIGYVLQLLALRLTEEAVQTMFQPFTE